MASMFHSQVSMMSHGEGQSWAFCEKTLHTVFWHSIMGSCGILTLNDVITLYCVCLYSRLLILHLWDFISTGALLDMVTLNFCTQFSMEVLLYRIATQMQFHEIYLHHFALFFAISLQNLNCFHNTNIRHIVYIK